MSEVATKEEAAKRESPGCLTYLVVYAVAVTVLYFVSTAEIKGNFAEAHERRFRIAEVSRPDPAKGASVVTLTLAQVKARTAPPATVSFLLPEGDIKVDVSGSDFHKVTVLERHRDWQLVEYRYGNTYDSVSRYKAYRDRVEPVSFRFTMSPGLLFGAAVLLVPAAIVAALINLAWRWIARRRKAAGT